MGKKIKAVIIILLVAGAAFLLYRLAFIRTVYYEIGGIKIPSKYNILTGKVVPIKNYRGRANLPAIQPSIKGNLGLPSEQAEAAKLRWALFEEWVSQMPQYKDWQSNPETFKKAMEEVRKFVSG